MTTTPEDRTQQSRRFLIATGFAFFVVFVTRALAFPHSWWLEVEPLLGMALGHTDPLAGRPPSPGFPLYLDLASLLVFKAQTPFVALVAASFLAGVAATVVLATALRRVWRDPVGGALASLLFFMTPAMLVFSSTPAPEAAALMFYATALLAAVRIADGEEMGRRYAAILGAAAGCCIGCQPEWSLAVLVLVASPLVRRESWRLGAISIAVCGGVFALVFAPLAKALGGEAALFRWLLQDTGKLVPLAPMALLDASGPLWLSIPIAAAALTGAFATVRSRETRMLLLAVPALVHLAYMALRGSVRVPVLAIAPVSVLLIALCARGLAELTRRTDLPPLRIAIVAAYCLASWTWTAPLLRARLDVAPPPSKAAIWINDHLEGVKGGVVLVADELEPHAAALITNARIARLDAPPAERAAALFALVPGESTQAGARVFAWPDSEPLRRLAGSRFRVVSVVPLRKLPAAQ
ncbi:MAG: hypothetical protein WC538_07795 [Thermoanaerobaculia bacterium]|jgi:hypothetical protein